MQHSLSSISMRVAAGLLAGAALWVGQYPAALTTSAANASFSVYDDLRYTVADGQVTIIGWEPENEAGVVTRLAIPSTIDDLPVTAVADYAFSFASRLTEITIAEGVATIGQQAFWNCTGLVSITLPQSVTELGQGAFSGCDAIEEIHIAQGNAIYSSQDGVVFSQDGTQLVYYPKGRTGDYTVPTGTEQIAKGAFEGATGLTQLTIPEGVTQIGANACSGCTGLTAIALPVSLTYISNYAFAGCDALSRIDYAGTERQWNQIIAYSTGNDVLSTAAIYVAAEPEPEEDENAGGNTGTSDNTGSAGQDVNTTPDIPAQTKGDVDGDGKITIQDAYRALMAYSNSAAGLADGLTSTQRTAGDIDGNGQISIQDAYQILQYYATASAGGTPTWTW